jgi:hypothetical protein
MRSSACRLGEAGADQDRLVLLERQVGVGDGPPAGRGDDLGQLGHRERLAAELVDRALVAVTGQHCRSGLGEVGASRCAHLAGARRARDAVLEVDRQLAGVVLDVPAVAQQGVGHTGLGQQLLRREVLRGQQQRGGVGPQDAGVGDELHAGGLRGVDRVAVLPGALADLAAGDQQQLLRAGERLAQGRLVVEVRTPDDDAALGQVGEGLGPPSGRDDLLGRDAAPQQGLDDQAAQVTGGAGDDDRHVLVLLRELLTVTGRGDLRPTSSNPSLPRTLPVGEWAL